MSPKVRLRQPDYSNSDSKTVVINEDTLSILQMLRLDGHVASRRLCHWATQYRSKLRTEVGAKGTDSGIAQILAYRCW